MKNFKQRVADGDTIVCAEGYIFEVYRRGYVAAGSYIPEFILEHPQVLEQIHREFAHAGSDVLVACQYYANRVKLEEGGLLERMEEINKIALRICTKVAKETGTLAAGNLCNSIQFDAANPESVANVRQMFKDQVEWSVEAGVDLIVCETFREFAEAKLALQVCSEFAPGVATVVTLAPYHEKTRDGVEYAEALQTLHAAGATMVGLNCAQGPETMIDTARVIRQSYKGPMSLCPVPLRTTPTCKTRAFIRDSCTGKLAYPDNLETASICCDEATVFGRNALELGVKMVGLCCGNCAKWTRALTLGVGKSCPGQKFASQAFRSNMHKIRKENTTVNS